MLNAACFTVGVTNKWIHNINPVRFIVMSWHFLITPLCMCKLLVALIHKNSGWRLSVMADKLTKKDLRTVRNAVYDVAAKWYDLGLELGIPADYLDTIKTSHSDPQDCLREMLRRWLSGVDPEPSWKVLSDALRNQAVGFQYLADRILKEKCNSCTTQYQEDSSQLCSTNIEQDSQTDNAISFDHCATLEKKVVGSSSSDLNLKLGEQESTLSISLIETAQKVYRWFLR